MNMTERITRCVIVLSYSTDVSDLVQIGPGPAGTVLVCQAYLKQALMCFCALHNNDSETRTA